MCTVCGCGEDDASHAHPHQAPHPLAPGHHHYGLGAAGVSISDWSQARIVRIEQDVLGKNDGYARHNRIRLEQQGIVALNLVSGPGSGKTTLLECTLRALSAEIPMTVIEGDQQTSRDADRIRATGARALQINTGKGCHLDAHQVGRALDELQPEAHSLLFIENVGNLVCPALFDLGEVAKVVMLSVTEGEDKPLKYPDMFHRAGLVIINKTDLLPYLRFDLARCLEAIRQINGDARVLLVSAETGEGMDAWYDWLRHEWQKRLRDPQMQEAAAGMVQIPV